MIIPEEKQKDQHQYEGGQAGALRDKKKIEGLKRQNDLKNPEIAFEVYEYLVSNPYYFESELGKQFLKELLKTAIHSDTYLMDEKVVSGRMSDQEFDAVDHAVKKVADVAVKDRRNRRHKKKQPANRKRKKSFIGLLIVILVICIVIFGKSIYEMIDYNIKSYESEKKIEELISCILEPVDAHVSEENRLDDLIASGLASTIDSVTDKNANGFDDFVVLHQYSELYERNHDMAGWISIEDSIINYPVMLTKSDQEYYLKRDFDRNDDLCGLPFMDAGCEIENPQTSFLIYGHNMKNGSMFSSLLKYEDYEYYEAHSSIRFDTIFEEGIYDIISVFQTQVAYQDEDTFRYYDLVDEENEKEYNTYIQKVIELSFYNTGITANYGDQLLILSTCDRRIENGRFVVVARKRN